MKINNREELEQFFENNCKRKSSYALVTYEGKTTTIYINCYKNLSANIKTGKLEDYYLEAPNCLSSYRFKGDADAFVSEYVNEIYDIEKVERDEAIKYIKSMIRGNILYEIDSPQTGPFLPEKIDDIKLITEQECLDWIIENEIKERERIVIDYEI